jgi:hypothetical protein
MINMIAFAGTKQSGKTTCATEVLNYWYKNTLHKKAKIYNFADPLKRDICMNILGLTEQQCYGSDFHKNALTDIIWDNKKLSAREVMQFVGTDLFRKMKHNVWANATIIKINNEKPSLALIADCRFPNEVESVQKAGGLVIRLTRKPFNSDHASEVALEKENYDWNNFDFVLDNANMTLEDQKDKLIQFLKNKGILPL